jgi:glycogen(starch) synthase
LRVLHVLHSSHPDVTGSSIRSRYIVETQARLGLTPLVATSPFQRPADAALARGVERFGGIPYYRCFAPKYDQRFMVARKSLATRARKLTALASFVPFVRRIARDNDVQIIHGHSIFFSGLAAALAARALGIPSIYEVRSLIEDTLVLEGGASERSPIYRAYRLCDNMALRVVDHVITISRGLQDDLISRGVDPARITVVPNGVDATGQEVAPPPDEALRGQLELPPEAFVVGYIGTLYTYESLDLAIDAVANLASTCPRLYVLIVGSGTAAESLRDHARKRGVEDRVRFVGRVDHDRIAAYYGLIDLFLLPRRPSRLTNLVTPLKPLEIMARAKPVLASNCGGHRELIEHGENGLLYDAAATDGLTEAIRSLYERTAELADLGRRARDWVTANRSWEQVLQPALRVYADLADASRRRSHKRDG